MLELGPAGPLCQVVIREAYADEAAEVEALLAENFVNNPAMLLIFGSAPSSKRLQRLFRDMTREPSMKTWVATLEGKIVGALKEVDWPQCNPNFTQKVLAVWDSVIALGWRAFFTITLYYDRKNHPGWAHRHLMILGVREEARRKGVATELLTNFCNRADETNISAFLETDTRAARDLYRRFGFHTVTTDNYNGVEVWYMWRQKSQNTDLAEIDYESAENSDETVPTVEEGNLIVDDSNRNVVFHKEVTLSEEGARDDSKDENSER